MKHTWCVYRDLALTVPPLQDQPRERLAAMAAAAREVQECYRVLKKGGANIVSELLKGQGKFYEMNHYPKGDVHDKETGSQYYYHAHRGLSGEHGHFHTFLRGGAIPDGIEPVPYDGEHNWPRGKDALTHLVAVSMDRYGFPVGFFATNRWVTDEAWYRAGDIETMLEHFEVDHAYPSWPANRWLAALLRLYRPQVIALLRQRNTVVQRWAEEHPERDVYEDRKLEITGSLRIHVSDHIKAVVAAAP